MKLLFIHYLFIILFFLLILPGNHFAAIQVKNGDEKVIRKIKDVVIYQNENFYSAFPSVIKNDSGEILVAFRRAPDRRIFGEQGISHVDPNSYLVVVRSKDNANSWSKEPELLHAHPFGGSQDPCLIKLDNGTILCTSYGWAFVNENGLANLRKPVLELNKGVVFLGGYVLRSIDMGNSWNGPYYPPNIPPEIKYSALGNPLPAYNRGALCEGKDGRIFWVVAAGTERKNIRKTSNYLLISDDKGLTWKYSCPVAEDDSVAFNETSVYETPSGDLVAFIRTAGLNDQACIARSSDRGKSFGQWEEMGFQGHPLHAMRLPDNRVLLVYGYRHKPYGIRARILNAECTDYKTAEEIVIRNDGGSHDIGYPWAVLLENQKILVTYYFHKDNGTRHIAGSILDYE